MAVIYESRRVPTSFIRADVGDLGTDVYPGASPRNGSLATSSLMSTIVNNEHWLAMRDVPMMTFFEAWANGDNDVTAATDWTASSKTITLDVPPFCNWAEFHFLCARDMDTTVIETHGISVISSVATVIQTGIPFGEDIGITGKTIAYASADWVHLQGLNDGANQIGPTALRLDTGYGVGHWTKVSVVVTIDPHVHVFSAAYRIVPAFGVLQVQV